MTISTERRSFIQGAGLVAAAASTTALAASPAFAQTNQPSGVKTMPYQAKPLSLDPKSIKGISEKVLVSHYENNHVGAVKRLNAIGTQLAELDFAKAPNFMINGLKREELVAANSMILHEIYPRAKARDRVSAKPARSLGPAKQQQEDKWTIDLTKEDRTMRKMQLWIATSICAASFASGTNAQKIDWQIFAEPFVTSAHAQDIDWQKVDDAFGRKPAVSGDVHRYGFPRTDLTVILDGVTIKPALALGGWIALKPAHGGAMVMGDLVLLDSEVNPVMLKLIEGGLEVTAVHNHLLRASPATFYLHVGGHGDPAKMAAVIRDALGASKTPLSTPAAAGAAPAIDLDTAQLDQIIGVKGQANGGVYQLAVPRRDPVSENEMPLNPVGLLGVANAIGFQPTDGGKAAITGDFVLTGDEVNPVIKELRANGIDVTAVHSHMLDEQPRLFFLHFWAVDDALKLAKGLRAALDKTASTKS